MDDAALDVNQILLNLSGLVDNLLLLLSDKEKVVVEKRFCLTGDRRFTLEEIGKDFSVTRERIRQIERNALSKMKRNVFNTALADLHSYVDLLVKEQGGLMCEESVLGSLVEIFSGKVLNSHRVHFSLVLHDDLECIGNTINFHPYLRTRALSDYSLKYASNKLINQMHKYGDAKSIGEVCDDLKDILAEIDFDIVKVKSLIEIDKRVTLLDDDLVALLEWRHIRPRTLRDKVLYVLRSEKTPMHFNDIAAAIESAVFDKRPVNVQAVHNELIRNVQFVLIGRGIYALKEWGYEKGTVVDVIERILKPGMELEEEQIIAKVLDQRQVKRITVQLALKNSGKFERIGRKIYKGKPKS